MHWADSVAAELLARGGGQVIETGTSISGIPHVGNASDIIRADAIRKALKSKGVEAELIWVSDDSDPLRKIPRGLEKVKDYLGYPVKDIPDPFGCHRGFVEHFVEPFLSDLKAFGVAPVSYSGTELYRSGALYPEIKVALDRSREIAEILDQFREHPLPKDYIPWSPICHKCGKISSAKPLSRSGDLIKYVCETREIAGGTVEGCGHEGESDVRKGEGKLPWRVEWAARWSHFKVTCEPMGKEHASAGGSYWTSKIVSEKIFGWLPPLPVMYEFFTLNGAKISSSKGNVITLGDWLRLCEPEVLRFFMYKRLQKQRDIDLKNLPNLVDEYDDAERVFFKLQDGEDELRRQYEFSQIGEPKLLQVPFTLCAVLAQAVPDLDEKRINERVRQLGYSSFDSGRLMRRVRLAQSWNSTHGPDYLQFTLLGDEASEEARKNLGELQQKALSGIAAEVGGGLPAEVLHKRIYEISREIGIKPQEVFEAVYLVLIGKKKGPKAASFILSLDVDFVRRRFSG